MCGLFFMAAGKSCKSQVETDNYPSLHQNIFESVVRDQKSLLGLQKKSLERNANFWEYRTMAKYVVS